jgi:hypothetical protein
LNLTGSLIAVNWYLVLSAMPRLSTFIETATIGSAMTEDEKIRILENQLEELRSEFHGYVDQKREEESKRLRAALMVAGGVIMALMSFVWVEIIWPVIKAGKS